MLTSKYNPEDGGLLVEVLVGMLILVIVFTATTIALSNMGDTRVKIEQRDRAVAILAKYEELSRIFQCGFIVDKIDDSLVDGTLGSGEAKFKSQIKNCDFEWKESSNPSSTTVFNGGDQVFTVKDDINENHTKQVFEVAIHYWWEQAGANGGDRDCATIQSQANGVLPLILVRAISVDWQEEGIPRSVSVVKRDPIPADNVVFALGNRVSVLVENPANDLQNWYLEYDPYGGGGKYVIRREIDFKGNAANEGFRIGGQPGNCAWFPYITPDKTMRHFSSSMTDKDDNNVGTAAPLDVTISDSLQPGAYKVIQTGGG